MSFSRFGYSNVNVTDNRSPIAIITMRLSSTWQDKKLDCLHCVDSTVYVIYDAKWAFMSVVISLAFSFLSAPRFTHVRQGSAMPTRLVRALNPPSGYVQAMANLRTPNAMHKADEKYNYYLLGACKINHPKWEVSATDRTEIERTVRRAAAC